MSVDLAVKCKCGDEVKTPLCEGCIEDKIDNATDGALTGYTPDEEIGDNASAAVFEWLAAERIKPITDITPEIAAIIERCAEDLR